MKIVRVKINGHNTIIAVIEKREEHLKKALKNAWYLACDEWEKIKEVIYDDRLKDFNFEIIEEIEL